MRHRLFFVLLIVVCAGCGDHIRTSVSGKNVHDGSVKLWDIKRGPDGHDYLRFAVGTPGIDGAPEDCSVLHSGSCSHPECNGKKEISYEPASPDVDNMTKIWEIETLDGHDYLRFAVGCPGISTDVRGCSLTHATGCRHLDCRTKGK